MKASAWDRWEESHLLVRSLIIGLLTILPGILLLWLASSWAAAVADTGSTDVVGPTILAEASTAVISLGLLGIVYEGFLKRGLLRDIQQNLQLNTSVTGTGLTNVTLELGDLRHKDLFRSSRTVHIFPASPLTWHEKNFDWLAKLAHEQTIDFRVYLPDPVAYSAWRHSSGEYGSTETEEYCEDRFRAYRSLWSAAGLDAAKSQLTRYSYHGYPHVGFIVGDNSAVVQIEDPRGLNTALGGIAYVYQGPGARPTINWLLDAINRLDSAAIEGSRPDERDPEDILPSSAEAHGSRTSDSVAEEKSGA